MKLYTEEELRKHLYNHDESFFEKLTPIELPSDEEIEKKANEYVEKKWEYAQDENKESFADGAKWMRDKIKGGDK